MSILILDADQVELTGAQPLDANVGVGAGQAANVDGVFRIEAGLRGFNPLGEAGIVQRLPG
ncbi:MAG: hypothetical protein EOP82_05530 [Variovorax sp.]|nr:MAG: hypothetical protein EOP82_05530 [Variovorax sp.]